MEKNVTGEEVLTEVGGGRERKGNYDVVVVSRVDHRHNHIFPPIFVFSTFYINTYYYFRIKKKAPKGKLPPPSSSGDVIFLRTSSIY